MAGFINLQALKQMRHDKAHPPAPVPADTRFDGQTVLVTGSSRGVGRAAAELFATHGAAHLILAVRDVGRGNEVGRAIQARSPDTRITVWDVNMESWNSIAALAARIDKELDRLDIAVLNAGVLRNTYNVSPEGWEEDITVNSMGTTLLAWLLVPILKSKAKSKPSETSSDSHGIKTSASFPHLIVVASQSQFDAAAERIPKGTDGVLRQLSNEPSPPHKYDGSQQYAISKLLLMWVLPKVIQAAQQPDSDQPAVVVTSCCPGPCQSDLSRDIGGILGAVARPIFMNLLLRTPEEGARTLVKAAAAGPKQHGAFVSDDQIKESRDLLHTELASSQRESIWQEMVAEWRAKNVAGAPTS